MDTIHDIDNKPWIAKKYIYLDELLKERETQLGGIISPSLKDDESIDYHEDLTKKLEAFVSSTRQELRPHFLFNSTDERSLLHNSECKLKTYELQLAHAKKMIADRSYKVSYLINLKTTRRELLMRHLALVNQSDAKDTIARNNPPVDGSNERLIAIVVIQTWSQPSRGKRIKLQKEIEFRSDQSLTELRHQFKCHQDYQVPIELSENPDHIERIFRSELFKSGFFLIGDTFYNDMRDRNNIDLSEELSEWASKKIQVVDKDNRNAYISRGIGPFKRQRMEDHTFKDIKFRLGCPYLYLHQGDCEHLFTISDVRYVVDSPALRNIKFPYITATSFGGKEENLRCYMCKKRPPHWYTRNNDRLPTDPFFFCESCFYSFNYTKDKEKIGSFQAYLFTNASEIPDNVATTTNGAVDEPLVPRSLE